ncbi:TetR/AcrR family transcriptional regulator [Clostridium thailandense]|uniref:TetR/AcrR family transcriptional regulator n=1 Tax=Clostridium thailandense TaxID=2794346 RepID=UPI003989F8EA
MKFFISRKERIILTAIEIISDLGFQGLSTKEITRRQEISDGTLYKHFKSKEDIILGALDYYVKFDDSIKESIEISRLSSEDSIKFFLKMMTEYYENYPAITALVVIQETLEHEGNIGEKSKRIFNDRSNLIMHYIEKGKKVGELRNDIDSEVFTDIILGSIREIILKWRMSKFNFPLKERAMNTLEIILKSYR